MSKIPRWQFPAALLIGAFVLSACGGGNETPPTGTGARPPIPPLRRQAGRGGAGPQTGALAATSGPSGGGSLGTFQFDPATYQKNVIEPGAQWRVSSWGDTSEQQVNRDALKRFNQGYPDVKITYEPQPSDYGTKLFAQIKGGSPPDVFYLDVDLPYQLIPNHVLLDLTPALTEVGRSKDDYFPNLTAVFLGPDGQVYGLPKDFTSLALFYNTDLVKTPPQAGWTQDDFTAWVQANTAGSGQTRVFVYFSGPAGREQAASSRRTVIGKRSRGRYRLRHP